MSSGTCRIRIFWDSRDNVGLIEMERQDEKGVPSESQDTWIMDPVFVERIERCVAISRCAIREMIRYPIRITNLR